MGDFTQFAESFLDRINKIDRMVTIPLPLILIILSILSENSLPNSLRPLRLCVKSPSPKDAAECGIIPSESKEREHVQNAIPQAPRQKPPINSVRRSARRAELPRTTSPKPPHERGKSSAGLRAIHATTQGIAAQDKGSDKAGPRESIMLVCTNYHDAFTKSSCCFSETIMMVSLSGTRLRPHSCRVPTVVVRRISPDPAEACGKSCRETRQIVPRKPLHPSVKHRKSAVMGEKVDEFYSRRVLEYTVVRTPHAQTKKVTRVPRIADQETVTLDDE